MIQFTRRVGVAPGTTTLIKTDGLELLRDGLGMYSCLPPPGPNYKPAPWRKGRKPKPPHEVTAWQPYPTISSLQSGGLGIVLTPWEVNRTLPGGPPFLEPWDPQYNTAATRGWYYDTPLGEIPTDAEYATTNCSTPVRSGWITTTEGYVPPPWRPDGYRPAGRYGPETSALGQAVDDLTTHQKRVFWLMLASTLAAVSIAGVTIYKALKS